MKFDYLSATLSDVVERFKPFLDSGDIVVNEEGKLQVRTKAVTESPWIHAKVADHRLCPLYHAYYAPLFGFIHPTCMECWKVVARPQTLSDLVKALEWQYEYGKPSKSGIERRKTVPANYGCYWYGNTIEEGQQIKKDVQKFFDENFPDAPPVILKRGCTEYEHQFGASDKWELTEHQKAIQEYLDEIVEFDLPPEKLKQRAPHYVELHTMRRWVEFAYERGDETYKEFTGGRSLYPDYVKY